MVTQAGSKLEQMFDFESRWFRLGGGPSDEIHDRFGMSDRAFFGEMNDALSRADIPDSVDPREADLMRPVIRRRLWLAR
jgi:hypothetical protein